MVRTKSCEMTLTERNLLAALLLVYLAASFLHFAHNAEFLSAYPDLPAWLARSDIYLTWAGLAAIGVGGFALYVWTRHSCGMFLLGLYIGPRLPSSVASCWIPRGSRR
jgi:hypothetical protein